jgi:polyisoprenoid-binding protein YceI
MRRARVLLLIGVAVTVAAPLAAAPRLLELDGARTSIEVRFGATLQNVRGRLGPVAGTVEFDDQTGNPAGGAIVVDLLEADTGVARRNRKMHEKILETQRYPRAVFSLERIDLPSPLRPGRNTLQLHGVLDLHGSRHALSLPVVAIVEGEEVTATGFTTIPYVEWGLRDPSYLLLRVAKEVRVDVKATGRLKTPPPPVNSPGSQGSQEPPPPRPPR